MTRKIKGPVHDLDAIKQAFKEGRVEFAGIPPTLRGEPDFSITGVRLLNSFDITWQTKSAGFGGFYFYTAEDGTIHCGNEIMSKEFIRSVLNKMVDDMVLDDEVRKESKA